MLEVGILDYVAERIDDSRYFGKFYICYIQGKWARDIPDSPSLELAKAITYTGGKYNA